MQNIHSLLIFQTCFYENVIFLGYPTDRGPICYDCRDIHAPQDCHKIVPCSSNEVNFDIFKLQHLSVSIKRTYTLELDVKRFILMYKYFLKVIVKKTEKSVLHIHECLYKQKL